ncbi:hypothetical protein Q0590_09055 [Rhodocytophaga aerolata]|uniref:Uncharacterized protein n=2 Tax=Rhodocytophaga aerolata TaxID=455078 RepID=A0ABT8R6S9_9BACT|nr:hypothetical protein [Rhodocytophaga aerolata]MDO1446395.1 hypothetical protein [Rhodocytophaga aerolata]
MNLFTRWAVYGCLLCMLNTLFFAPIETTWVNKQSVALQAQEDPDNSLLEILLEDYLDASDCNTDPQDDTDDVLKKMEYVTLKTSIFRNMPVSNLQAKKIASASFFVNPFLETLTPPPQYLFCV